MATTVQQLAAKHCQACEGGVPPVPGEEAERLVRELSGWELSSDRKRIRRRWKMQDFLAGIDFFQRVAQLAEKEDHHPDLHLVNYRELTIELWTHAIGGLSENDFILAAKINELPVKTKSG